MPTFLPDTSCMVAAVCGWHEHYTRAAREIERRLTRGDGMVVAGHALAEAYSVLTRFPPPHRLSPQGALTLLDGNFMNGTKIIALDGKSYRTLLRNVATGGITGGRTYDAIIAMCTIHAKVSTLLTFNEQHFHDLAQNQFEIVVPE